MSKYELAVWPQDKYRFAIYDNVPRYKRAKDILKANPGAKGAINLALFAMVNYPAQGVKVYDHQADVKIAGKWEYGPRWLDVIGICIDKNGFAYAGKARDAVDQNGAHEYAACKTVNYLNDKLEIKPGNATNGLTYYALRADGTMLTLLVSKDNPVSPAIAVQILLKAWVARETDSNKLAAIDYGCKLPDDLMTQLTSLCKSVGIDVTKYAVALTGG